MGAVDPDNESASHYRTSGGTNNIRVLVLERVA